MFSTLPQSDLYIKLEILGIYQINKAKRDWARRVGITKKFTHLTGIFKKVEVDFLEVIMPKNCVKCLIKIISK